MKTKYPWLNNINLFFKFQKQNLNLVRNGKTNPLVAGRMNSLVWIRCLVTASLATRQTVARVPQLLAHLFLMTLIVSVGAWAMCARLCLSFTLMEERTERVL